MTIEYAVDLIETLIFHALMLSSPILGTAIVVGVSVSLIQTITSIQEQTLTFVPKLFSVAIIVLVSAHWLMRNLMEFCTKLFQQIADVGL